MILGRYPNCCTWNKSPFLQWLHEGIVLAIIVNDGCQVDISDKKHCCKANKNK
jgi:hypothetical protein